MRVFIRAARAPKAPAPQNDVAITSRARVQINEYNPVTSLVWPKVHKIKTSFPSPYSWKLAEIYLRNKYEGTYFRFLS